MEEDGKKKEEEKERCEREKKEGRNCSDEEEDVSGAWGKRERSWLVGTTAAAGLHGRIIMKGDLVAHLQGRKLWVRVREKGGEKKGGQREMKGNNDRKRYRNIEIEIGNIEMGQYPY